MKEARGGNKLFQNASLLMCSCSFAIGHFLILKNKSKRQAIRPLAGYDLPPPPTGNFVDHIFLEAQCLAGILQHVSSLTMAALSCNSLLHTLPYKIFDN